MAIKDAFIAEIKQEASLTKKLLERVPADKKDWVPHEKSMPAGRLALHVAEINHWASVIVHIDDFDFLKDYTFRNDSMVSTEQLLEVFQTNLDKAIQDLSTMTDEDFDKLWTVRRGEQVMYSVPKKVAVRGWVLSHMIHHRGQLSVYLRLLGIPVPAIYGPSADEQF
ncbi:MAG: DinB family protein [Bacteroidota bacterium]